jgi:hypothetical protein
MFFNRNLCPTIKRRSFLPVPSFLSYFQYKLQRAPPQLSGTVHPLVHFGFTIDDDTQSLILSSVTSDNHLSLSLFSLFSNVVPPSLSATCYAYCWLPQGLSLSTNRGTIQCTISLFVLYSNSHHRKFDQLRHSVCDDYLIDCQKHHK